MKQVVYRVLLFGSILVFSSSSLDQKRKIRGIKINTNVVAAVQSGTTLYLLMGQRRWELNQLGDSVSVVGFINKNRTEREADSVGQMFHCYKCTDVKRRALVTGVEIR